MYKEIYNHKTVRIIEYMMKEYLILLNNYKSIKDIIKNDKWNDFILLNDDIMNEVFRLPVEKNIFELYSIIENIYSRKLHEHQISFISKNENKDINQERYNMIYDNNIIIDKVRLKYYSNENVNIIMKMKIKKNYNKNFNNKYIIKLYINEKTQNKDIYRNIIKRIIDTISE